MRRLLALVLVLALGVALAAKAQVGLPWPGPGTAGGGAPAPTITRVGSATASATTVTCPAHVAGDFIVIVAVRGASATAPTLPSGYVNINTATISTSVALAIRVGYRVANATNDSSGTWTNANELICIIYHPSTSGYTLVGGQISKVTSTTTTLTYPAMTLADSATGNSWVIGLAGASNLTQTLTAPSGMTAVNSVAGASYQAAAYDTNAGVTSWSSAAVTVGTGHSGAVLMELVLAPTANTFASTYVYQHIGGGGNPAQRGQTGTVYTIPVDESSGAGNLYALKVTGDGGVTAPTVSDNVNGAWPSATVSALGGTGNLDSYVFLKPNIAGGQTTISVTYSAADTTFEYDLTELHGVATASPANGSTSTTNVTTTAAGSFTPGANTGGNLVLAWFVKNGTSPTSLSTHILPGANFSLLNADVSWNQAQTSLVKATEAYAQVTPAAINPAITSANDSADDWNNLAVAIKVSSGAGTAPANAIRVNGIQHFATISFPSSGTYVVQAPQIGNLRTIQSDDPNLHALTVTDSEGNTYTGTSSGVGVWYLLNSSANPNLIYYITGGGAGVTLSWRATDSYGPGTWAFDSDLASNQVTSGLSSFTQSPSPSVTATNGIIWAAVELGQGPGLGVTSPAGAIWDLCTYTGEVDTDLMENADILAHYKYSASGSQTWTFTITNNPSNNTAGGFAAFHQ